MKTLRLASLASLAALALSACVSITPVPAGSYTAPGPYQVTLDRDWADVSALMPNRAKAVKVLSIDGPLLNRMYMVGGLKPGEYIIRPLRKEMPTPVYRASLSVTETIEFITESVAAMDYKRVESARPQPTKFDGHDGVRFELSAKTDSGLDIKGAATVAQVDGKLYAIIYLAPAEHYFEAHLKNAEAAMSTARLSGGKT